MLLTLQNCHQDDFLESESPLQVNSPNELACCSLTAFVSLPLISKFVITSVLTTSSLGETYKKDKPNAARHLSHVYIKSLRLSVYKTAKK